MRRHVVLSLLVGVLIVSGCVGDNAGPTGEEVLEPETTTLAQIIAFPVVQDASTSQPSVVVTSSVFATTVYTPTLREFNVTAKRFVFVPSEMYARRGDRVRLRITSIDTVHGFRIRGLNINEKLLPHMPVTVEFVAKEAGNYSFHCSEYCGSGHGSMGGLIIVE